jgi:hypothetical protein
MEPMVSPARANRNDARDSDEHAPTVREAPGRSAPRRIGRLRLPITLTARPWATLYEMADGRRF